MEQYIPAGAPQAVIAGALMAFFLTEAVKKPLRLLIKNAGWHTYAMRLFSWLVGALVGWLQQPGLAGVMAGLIGGYFSNQAFDTLEGLVMRRLGQLGSVADGAPNKEPDSGADDRRQDADPS